MIKNRNNRNQQPTAAQSNRNSTGETDQLTPQQRHEKWTNEKVERAKQDNYNTVSQKTKDTAATVNFINIIDNLMYHVRMNAGATKSIPAESLQKYIDKVDSAKATLNLVAAEMCRDMGRPYRPPRGFSNPLANVQSPARKQEKKPQGNDSKKTGKSAQLASEKPAALETATDVATDLLAIPPAATTAEIVAAA